MIKRQIGLLLLAQATIGIITIVILFLFDGHWGLSAAFGVITIMLGQCYMALRTFWRLRKRRQVDPKDIVMGLYRGAFGKIVILGISIYLCHTFFVMAWWAYMVGVAMVQFGSWLAPFWFNRKG